MKKQYNILFGRARGWINILYSKWAEEAGGAVCLVFASPVVSFAIIYCNYKSALGSLLLLFFFFAIIIFCCTIKTTTIFLKNVKLAEHISWLFLYCDNNSNTKLDLQLHFLLFAFARLFVFKIGGVGWWWKWLF